MLHTQLTCFWPFLTVYSLFHFISTFVPQLLSEVWNQNYSNPISCSDISICPVHTVLIVKKAEFQNRNCWSWILCSLSKTDLEKNNGLIFPLNRDPAFGVSGTLYFFRRLRFLSIFYIPSTGFWFLPTSCLPVTHFLNVFQSFETPGMRFLLSKEMLQPRPVVIGRDLRPSQSLIGPIAASTGFVAPL